MRHCNRLVSIQLFRTNFLIDGWFIISKSVNHVFDHGFKCRLGSSIVTDKSECAAKFRFASVERKRTSNNPEAVGRNSSPCNNQRSHSLVQAPPDQNYS